MVHDGVWDCNCDREHAFNVEITHCRQVVASIDGSLRAQWVAQGQAAMRVLNEYDDGCKNGCTVTECIPCWRRTSPIFCSGLDDE